MPEPCWISLCCGLAATECRAMTGRFPPVARMGGKRAVADGVLDILGSWPKRWLLIDADLAIVEFWQAAFLGLLPAVAEVIRNAPADGEELWRLWTSEPVPVDPVERVTRWLVCQSGAHASVPVSANGNAWARTRGPLVWKYAAGGHPAAETALRVDLLALRVLSLVGRLQAGAALFLDLAASSPVVRPGDLVTIDPPYRGTTSYGSALSRERVVELAQEAHEHGARVLVHEAEPVIEGGPWRSLELQRTRGKKQRTWSKQKAEWVTINFEPATAHPGAKASGSKQRLASRREMAPIRGPLFED